MFASFQNYCYYFKAPCVTGLPVTTDAKRVMMRIEVIDFIGQSDALSLSQLPAPASEIRLSTHQIKISQCEYLKYSEKKKLKRILQSGPARII